MWVDANSDGYSQTSELYTLGDLLVTSINLNATQVSYDIAGNPITHESTFTIDGQTHDIVDAWFAYDITNTTYVDEYQLDLRALFLPTARGYGKLPDLHIAMSEDETLLEMVRDFAATDLAILVDPAYDLYDKVADIMFRWAGVDGVSAASRGNDIDAKYLEFLEEFTGREWGGGGNPGWAQADILVLAWQHALEEIVARLAYQAVGSSFLSGAPSYQVTSDSIGDTVVIDVSATESVMQSLDSFSVQAGFGRLLVTFVESFRGIGELSQQEFDDLEALLPTPLTIEAMLNSVGGQQGGGTLYGSPDDNLLIAGSDGDFIIYGDDGNDVLISGTGKDVVFGGAGNDAFVFGLGDGALTGSINYSSSFNRVYEVLAEGSDTLIFESGVESGDLRMWTNSLGDLYIQYSASDYLMVDASKTAAGETRVGETRVGEYLEYITFADQTTWDLTAGLHLKNNDTGRTLFGSAYGDTIEGGAGNDYLYGYGGDDILYGGDGVDTLVFEAASAYNNVDQIGDFDDTEDVIDIRDLLTAYDPMSDLLTDFVQITDDGTHSTLAVDADGGADNFVAVASILNTTGLTDENALVSSGTLLAA